MAKPAQQIIARLRGAVIIEMVVVTPILLFLMLATAEVTRAFVDHNTLTKAVRNGARFVARRENSRPGTSGIVQISAAVQADARNLVVYGNVAGTGTPALSGFAPGDVVVANIGGENIQVTANYATTGILGPILPNFFGPNINLLHNLQATVTMRAL